MEMRHAQTTRYRFGTEGARSQSEDPQGTPRSPARRTRHRHRRRRARCRNADRRVAGGGRDERCQRKGGLAQSGRWLLSTRRPKSYGATWSRCGEISEERRVGKEGGSTCSTRRPPYNKKKKQTETS